ncbi:hypothetical protein ACP275_14G324900 [Erythranthe tilingii]
MESDNSAAGDDCTICKQHNEEEEEKHNFHVLAVDDSNIDRKLLERLLTVSSYQVTCVESGDKALEYLGLQEDAPPQLSTTTTTIINSCSFSSNSPSPPQLQLQASSKVNLIMTDYSMPGISGYDLLKRIKGSSWKDVPVVVMSSENVQSRINMCLEGGAEEFLLKPVKLSDLRKLHSHLVMNTDSCSESFPTVLDIDNQDSIICCEGEIDKNCSITNKRKATLATSSDLSDRRPRVQ